jgi:predicted HTH transcriptional regulator
MWKLSVLVLLVYLNKELMRVFRGLDMVEQLGSGIPQILAAYSQSIYHFTPNFIRLVFPFEEGFEVLTGQAAAQAEVNKNQGESDKDDVTAQANKLLVFCSKPRSMAEMMSHLDLTHRTSFRESILRPLLSSAELLQTIPDKPTSPNQLYIANSQYRNNLK